MLRNLRWYRYVWSELFPATSLGLMLWTFLLLMNTFFLVAERALAKNLGWDLTLHMFALEVPKVLVLTLPMAALTGTMIAVGRLSADHEWVALQGAGHGAGRLLRPVAAFGLGISLLGFAVYGFIVPRTNYAARTLRGQVIIASNLAADLSPGVFYTQLEDIVMFVENIAPESTGRMQGVLIHREDGPGGYNELYLARRGDIYPLPGEEHRIRIDLREGTLYGYRPVQPDRHQLSSFDRLPIDPPPPPFLQRLGEEPTVTDADRDPIALLQRLREARASTEHHPIVQANIVRGTSMELHQRFSFPAAALVFSVLALPLGMTRARSGKGAGFALSVVIILAYWVVFSIAKNAAARDIVPPWLGIWSGNLLIAPWAVAAYWRFRSARGERRGPVAWLFDMVRAVLLRLPRPGAPSTLVDDADGSEPLTDLGGTTRRFVGRLDTYVLTRFLRVSGLALAGGYLIYIVVELKQLMEGITHTREPLSSVLQYFVYAVPGMLILVLPVACLVGAVVAMALLTRTGELTAIKSSGVSVRRAALPILLTTGALCAALFMVQESIAPVTNRQAGTLKDQVLGRNPITRGMPTGGKWAFGPGGERLYHYRWYDEDRRVFQGLSLFRVQRNASPPRVLAHRFCDEAKWNGQDWEFSGGWIREYDAGGVRFETFEGTRIESGLAPPENFNRRETALAATGGGVQDTMKASAIRAQIQDLGGSGYDTTRLQVALWSKYAQACTPLVMVLIGLPFSFLFGTRGSLYGVGVALLLVLIYWATFAVFNALGLESLLPPLLAAWAPNILFSFVGVYLLLYVRT